MATKRSQKALKRPKPHQRQFRSMELRTIIYISTLLFAAFLAEKGVDTATIYGFLGMAVGAIFGKYFDSKR
jgi:hypothetical protein